jgi:signal transduction histidine kinase
MRDDVAVAGRLPAAAIGVVVGIMSAVTAEDSPAYSFAGTKAGVVALLLAGWSLVAAGLVFWSARPGNVVGPLLVVAGVLWFVAEWDSPGVGSPLVFTIGLVLSASCPVLVGVVVFAHPSGRMTGWPERVVVGALVTGMVILLGFGWAMSSDPQAAGCGDCADNLVLIDGDPGRAADLAAAGMKVGLVASVGVAGVIGWRLLRSSAAKRRLIAPVMISGALYFVAVGWTYAENRDELYIASGPLERRLWFLQAVALVLLGMTVVWGRLRNQRTRQSLVDVVVELGKTSGAGGLRDALAIRLGDADLELGYAIGERGWAAVDGVEIVPPPAGSHRTMTPLVRDGEQVAMIVHRQGVLDDADLVAEVTSAARLLLDNERLQADVRAKEADLRASRARIVEFGDSERRRLERDLHDGAQQRLVGLMLGLRLARAAVNPGDEELQARLTDTERELDVALAGLREVASGIHPAALSVFGLPEALAALAERSGHPVQIAAVPTDRLPPAVEIAAYQIVATAAAAGAVVAEVTRTGDRLHVDIDAEADAEPEVLLDLEDRVGALDGSLSVDSRDPSGHVLRAEIPCAS